MCYFDNVFRFVFFCNVFWVEFQCYCGGGGGGGGVGCGGVGVGCGGVGGGGGAAAASAGWWLREGGRNRSLWVQL